MLRQNIEMQLAEVELLQSMYPQEQEFKLNDVTMLEDLVTAAFRDALRKCGNVQAQALASAETSTLLPVTKE